MTNGKNSQTLIMQTDGNLCIYPSTGSNAIWCTMTNGKGGILVSMDNDSVLRMYNTQNQIVWSSPNLPIIQSIPIPIPIPIPTLNPIPGLIHAPNLIKIENNKLLFSFISFNSPNIIIN